MAVALSTLDRRTASGEVEAKREPRGSRHRVYVMLDDNPPEQQSDAVSSDPTQAVARERIRGLQDQVAFLKEQLEQ